MGELPNIVLFNHDLSIEVVQTSDQLAGVHQLLPILLPYQLHDASITVTPVAAILLLHFSHVLPYRLLYFPHQAVNMCIRLEYGCH